MCGICGVYGLEDRALIERMLSVLKHRGPDGNGIYTDSNISLGHTRLSIIDLSEKGKQPMSNEDGGIWLSVNGEIYNFIELRLILQKKGHIFHSSSDSEIIIHAYEEYGLDFVKYLRGMFALSLYDANKKRMILARDPIGKKPLYYYQNRDILIFASEIKAILQSNYPRKKIDNIALWSYLAYQYTIGERTLFEGIKKLLPGHMLVVTKGEIENIQYWDINENLINANEDFLIKKLYSLLEESVKLRLIADVPVGAFLSGGIDSSSVVALAKKHITTDLHTFSVGFEKFSEFEYAQIVSNHLDTNHHEILITSDMVLKNINAIAWYYDEPIGDAAIINNYFLSKEAKKFVKVILAGEGGDELFGGYANYYFNYYLLKLFKNSLIFKPAKMIIPILSHLNAVVPITKKPWPLRKISKIVNYAKNAINLPPDEFHQNSTRVMSDEVISKLIDIPECDINHYTVLPTNVHTTFNRMLALDCKNLLPEKFLMKADKGTMANSIEERAPLLDKEIIEFAFSIPYQLKIKNRQEKYILRKAMKPLLPKSIIDRPKFGFGTTFGHWMETDLFELVTQKIEDGNLIKKIMRPEEHKTMVASLNRLIKVNESQIWTLFALELWYDIYSPSM